MPVGRLLSLLTALLLALPLAACGSDSSEPTSGTSTSGTASAVEPSTARMPAAKGEEKAKAEKGGRGGSDASGDQKAKPPAEADPQEPDFDPQPHQDSGGGAKQFEAKGGDNSIQEYGEEPSGSDFAEAAEVLHVYLDARAAGAWDVACEQLAVATSEELVRQLGAAPDKNASCRGLLAGLTAAVPAAALREAAVADVGALRVEGDSGFLLFRGARGEDFFIPMRSEDGGWKVGAIAASPLP